MKPALTEGDRVFVAGIATLLDSPQGPRESVTGWRVNARALLANFQRLDVEADQLRARLLEADTENDRRGQALRDVARHHAAGDRVSVRYALDDAGFGRSL